MKEKTIFKVTIDENNIVHNTFEATGPEAGPWILAIEEIVGLIKKRYIKKVLGGISIGEKEE